MLAHIHPSPLRFTCRTRPIPEGSSHLWLTHPGSARCPEPLCPLRVLPFEGWCFPPPREALPPHHRSYGLMRQTKTPPTAFNVYNGSLQVVASPCWEMALPDVISASLSPGAWTLTPVGSSGAFARFFPENIGLPQITRRSAPTLTRTATSVRNC